MRRTYNKVDRIEQNKELAMVKEKNENKRREEERRDGEDFQHRKRLRWRTVRLSRKISREVLKKLRYWKGRYCNKEALCKHLHKKVLKYMYAAGKNKIKERRDRKENNVWDGGLICGGLGGVNLLNLLTGMSWGVLCVLKSHLAPFTPVQNRIGGRDQRKGYSSVCRWFRFAQLAKGKKSRP